MFYVSNQGHFDTIVRSELRDLQREYPQINYAVVLAYMPGKQTEYDNYSDTRLQRCIASVYPCYAIPWQNNRTLKQSDCVVTCITPSWDGVAQYIRRADSQKNTD